MATAHVKKGDEVVVLTGKEKGKRGTILQLLPKKNRAIVEGLMMIKRHEKQKDENTPGEIVEREGSIHVSNLMLATKWDERHSN